MCGCASKQSFFHEAVVVYFIYIYILYIYYFLCMGDNSLIIRIVEVELYFFMSRTEVKKQQCDYILSGMPYKNVISTIPGLLAFNLSSSHAMIGRLGAENNYVLRTDREKKA